jgi:hypothetical protein
MAVAERKAQFCYTSLPETLSLGCDLHFCSGYMVQAQPMAGCSARRRGRPLQLKVCPCAYDSEG